MSDLSQPFQELHARLAEAVLACRGDADKDAVHLLRTTRRRIEALLRKVLSEHPDAKKYGKKIEKALKQLRKARKAAGPVRDLDVQRKLCGEIVEGRRGDDDNARLQKEFAKMDRHLRGQRTERTKGLEGLSS